MHEKSSLVTKDFQSLVGRSKIKTWMKKTPRIMELGTISMSKERPMIHETRKGAPARLDLDVNYDCSAAPPGFRR